MHRGPDRRRLAGVLAISAALLVVGGGQGAQAPSAPEDGASAWRGFVDGDRRAVAIGQRMIVVLRNPSLADRLAEAGGTATESAMRQWTASALAAQKQIAARLSGEGIQLVPDFVYTRTFNGFSAPIDGRALALLDREGHGLARAHPDQPTRLERHGTQMAGLIAGSGPAGIHGVALAASILPIRVAGWQPSAEGGFAVYGRTDQLLAGIERAVDPDADGDVL